MKRILFFISLLLLSTTIKAQTIDTVDAKVAKISDRDYEIAPRFTDRSLTDYIEKNIQKPEGLQKNIKDYLVATMFVDTDGNISGIKLLKNLSPDIDQSVLQTLNSVNKVKAAIYDGQYVNLNFVITIDIIADTKNNTFKVHCWKYYPQHNTSDYDKQVFVAVEKEPEFPGGMAAFGQFLGQNIIYPTRARRNNIQGRVILTFVVDKQGKVCDMEVLRSPSDDLSIEALRVMRTCPNFNPGMQNGKPVRVQYTVPIAFSLGNR